MTEERIQEIIDIIRYEAPSRGDLCEYHEWDDLIECDEAMTLEEWEWAGANLEIERTVVVKRRS